MFPNDIAGSGAVEFNDVNDLKQFVADNIDDFAECLSQKLLSYATGRPVSYAEKQELRQGVTAVKSRGNGFQDLLVEVVTNKAFGTK